MERVSKINELIEVKSTQGRGCRSCVVLVHVVFVLICHLECRTQSSSYPGRLEAFSQNCRGAVQVKQLAHNAPGTFPTQWQSTPAVALDFAEGPGIISKH